MACKHCKEKDAYITQLHKRIEQLQRQVARDSWAEECHRQVAEELDYRRRMESGEWMGR